MAAENTQISIKIRRCNDWNNTTEEQVVVEELTVEEQLAKDLAQEKR
jgi:molecular chaperone GrpE